MYNITLISTYHSELGKCNPDELLKIFEAISPDVIFEELPLNLFNILYNLKERPNEPPESKSVKRYLQTHSIEHIPVDMEDSYRSYTKEYEDMLNAFNKNDAYKKLANQFLEMTDQEGYSYLNCDKCIELFEKKKGMETELINVMTNKDQLSHFHQLFWEVQDAREREMIENIYTYSKENKYNKAIFLLGAEHRKSIMHKIQAYDSKEEFKLNWKFYNA